MFQGRDLSAHQWYIARLALDYFALSSTSDAAPSNDVPRFQRSGDSSLFFASFRVPVCSDLLSIFAVYAFNRLLPCKLEVWEWVAKRRIFDPISEFSGRV